MREFVRLLRYFARYWAAFLTALLLMALSGGLDGGVALLLAPVVDKLLNPASGGGPILLLKARPPLLDHPIYLNHLIPAGFSQNPASIVALALVAFIAVKAVSEYAGTYLINYVGFGAITDLRNVLFEKLIHQSATFFHRHSTGRLMSTVVNDIERIQQACSASLADAVQQGFTLVFFTLVLLILSWKMTLYAFVLTPLVIFPTVRLGRHVRRTTRKGQDEMADVQHILHETVTGNRIVKAFNMEAREIARFRAAAHRLLRYNLRYIKQQGVSSPLMEILGAVTVILFLLFARGAIAQGVMSVGMVVAFLYALIKLYEPLRRMAGIYNSFQTAAGCAQRVFEFLDIDDEVRDRPGAAVLAGFTRSIQFDHVDFHYAPGEPVLAGATLEVARGEVVALVGSSGAGKTTLVNLIPRFFDVCGGRVLIDGHDVRDLTQLSLRAHIAYVTQDTILFNDTVASNIAYGAGGPPNMEAVREAARAALADEFIAAMPQGYDTMLGERGLRLSGGQRQRIAIARAIYKDAPVLILDEATSALDNESELLVQRALANLMRHRTSVIIAHRLSTVRNADRILVLDAGSIVESGTHDQLHAAAGLYRRLYDLQFADLDPAAPAPA
ncbi:MAG TPA: ABC transporter ATP-binding protein [Terriglobales bacterium]|jgi:subfamily B ATP-binding cassette protein MsbA